MVLMQLDIADELMLRIDKISEVQGYISRTEFVRDAVRKRLEEEEEKLSAQGK